MRRLWSIVGAILLLIALGGTALAQFDDQFKKGLKYYNSGRYSEAVRVLKEYVKHHPDARAYYMIGYSLYELKRFDEASKYFKDAYLIDPNFTPMK